MHVSSFNLPLVVLLPFLGALLAFTVARFNRLASAFSAALITLLALLLLWPSIPAVWVGQTVVQAWSWLPNIGFNIAFRLDGLSLLFSLLILLIGLLVILYARYYLSAKDAMGRFFAYLLLFMGSMLGVVLAENLLQLVVFWELTSLSSFLLISYWSYRRMARRGARMALIITGMGGLALLAGVLLLGQLVGSYQLDDILQAGEQVKASAWYTPILLLILLGVFTKSAQFPFHFWLPHAMAAPTPVSAYLHSATMVKAGIFLLARLFPVLSGTPEWFWLVGSAGMATLLLGAFTALFKQDLKGLLAYSTISHLGLITLLFGLGTQLAAVAAIFHVINHAIFKASLFMVAGIVDHETGTRDIRKLSGLRQYMPQVAVLAIIAAAAMAGVPLLNGFLSKEMFFDQTVVLASHSRWAWLLPLLATLAGIFSVAYSVRFIHDVFFKEAATDLPRKPHEPPRYMKLPVLILVIACVAVGIAPNYTITPLLAKAVSSTLQVPAPVYSLAIWHGFTGAFVMSLVALAGGIFIYRQYYFVFAWYNRTLASLDGRQVYVSFIRQVQQWASRLTRLLDQNTLQTLLLWVLAAALLAGSAGFLAMQAPLLGNQPLMPYDPLALVPVTGLILASLMTVVMHRYRLLALIMLGVVGLVIALGFAKFSAPDLALTQIAVEIVTMVLLMLALYFLPDYTPSLDSRWRHLRDVGWAVAAGLGAAILTLAVLTREPMPISDYFLQHSLSEGGGANVVNVILVDFRGFDTWGEILVLALAGLSIFALLQNTHLYAPQTDAFGRAWSKDAYPLILQVQARLIFPFMLMIAIFIFLRGHNLPGGGFIAGLIAALAIVLQNLANGIVWTAQRLRLDAHQVIAAGLSFALLTGIASWFWGYPFLTSTFAHLHWPVVGEFELASAIAFDLGVFLVVVGATVMILVQLGKLEYIKLPPLHPLQAQEV